MLDNSYKQSVNIGIVGDAEMISDLPKALFDIRINWSEVNFNEKYSADNYDIIVINTGGSRLASWKEIELFISHKTNSIYLNLNQLRSENLFKILGLLDKHNSVLFKRYTFVSETLLPTKFGNFMLFGFKSRTGGHNVLGLRTLELPALPVVRTHSMCYTGDIFGSLKCDCREEFENALKLIGKDGGMLIYPEEEGRGIGILNKIIVYGDQNRGLDTVDAQFASFFPNDLRTYDYLQDVFRHFAMREIRLITNNPEKVEHCFNAGVNVKEVIKLKVSLNEHNKGYLFTKMKKSRHDFALEFGE